MLITDREIDELDSHLNACWGDPWSAHGFQQDSCLNFLGENPHLLLPMGFQEARVWRESPESAATLVERFRLSAGFPGATVRRAAYRHADGHWYLVGEIGWPDQPDSEALRGLPQIRFWGEGGQEDRGILIDEVLNTLRGIEARRLTVESLIILPHLTSLVQFDRSIELAQSSRQLLKDIQAAKRSLGDLSPNDLEDVVAELMRARGHQVEQTKRTRDGGRDLIVTGEFFPGVRTQMAVEVTSMKVVGI